MVLIPSPVLRRGLFYYPHTNPTNVRLVLYHCVTVRHLAEITGVRLTF